MKFRFAALLVVCGVLSSLTFAQKRPFTVDDLFGVREVHDPQISPDARFIAYTVSATSLKEDKTETRIFMLPYADGGAVPLTAEGVSSSSPRWSPDG